MATATTDHDVFIMAIGMEQIGKDFYEALSLGSNDAKVRDFCLRAANEEAAHLAAFKQMYKQYANSALASRTSPETAAALASLAKGCIQPDPLAVRKVAIGGHLNDALAMALQMEHDSIHFYRSLLAQLPQFAQAIAKIVEEEQRHLTRLQSLARPIGH